MYNLIELRDVIDVIQKCRLMTKNKQIEILKKKKKKKENGEQWINLKKG